MKSTEIKRDWADKVAEDILDQTYVRAGFRAFLAERFAQALRDEREACAKVAEETRDMYQRLSEDHPIQDCADHNRLRAYGAQVVVDAIRGRK